MKFIPFFILFIIISVKALGQDTMAMIRHGENLFHTNCSPCHGIGKEKTGPSLASIPKKRPKEWLHKFIHNSQEVIISGDAYANHLFEQYNRNVMPAFKKFSSDDINNILAYIEYRSHFPNKTDLYSKVKEETGREGEVLFNNHCGTCHALNKEGYGPALASVTKRRSLNWLIPFIRNSQKVIHSGDPYANHLYQNFGKRIMVPFDFLEEKEIISILKYIELSSVSPTHIGGVNGKNLSPDKTPKTVYRSEFKVLDNYKEKSISGLFLKIWLIVFSFAAFLIFLFLIYKLFIYLSRTY